MELKQIVYSYLWWNCIW